MSDLSALLKRGAPSFFPDELALIIDPKDPMFDERVHNTVSDAAVLNLAANGYGQAVLLKPRGDMAIVDDGQQRVKRGLVLNALNGTRPYRGSLPSVKEAIERLRGSETGRSIVTFCSDAIKVPIMIFRGDEASAYRMKASVNEFREGDPTAVKIRRAQHMATRLSMEPPEIALALNVSIGSVRKYLAMDPDRKPTGKKSRGKSPAPSKAVVRKLLADGCPELSKREVTLLNFFGLGVGAPEFAAEFPKLAAAVTG